jgi:hypothetical protein
VTTETDRVCAELRRLRPRILRAKKTLEELYGCQSALLIEGYHKGVTVTAMAEALGVIDQTVRYSLRKSGITEKRRSGRPANPA